MTTQKSRCNGLSTLCPVYVVTLNLKNCSLGSVWRHEKSRCNGLSTLCPVYIVTLKLKKCNLGSVWRQSRCNGLSTLCPVYVVTAPQIKVILHSLIYITVVYLMNNKIIFNPREML